MRLPRWITLAVAATLLTGCAAAAKTIPPALAVEAPPSVLAGPPVPEPAPVAEPNLTALRRQLREYLAKQDGTYGVYVVDLVTGKSVGINSNKVFPAASTIKLPLALYVLGQVEQGRASLDEPLAYSWTAWEDGTGVLQDWIADGDTLTVRELVELAITQSDNIATNMLLERFGAENVYAYMHELGGTVTHTDEGIPGTTPREMAAFMKDVEFGEALSDAELRTFLRSALEHTAFTDRAAAGVPDGVTVAHKIGTLPGVVNDVALVEVPGRPFIISAFSLDVDDEVAPAVITEITRKVYDFLAASS